MFCRECGRQLPDYARFCDGCGAQVYSVSADVAEHEITVTQSDYDMAMDTSGPAPVRYVDDDDKIDEYGASDDVQYIVVHSYTKAAQIAMARGAKEWRRAYEGEEEMECEDCYPDTSIAKLMKMAEKEDQSNKKHGIRCSYVVSPEGAIGILVDEDDEPDLEQDIYWQVYTPERTLRYLPMWRNEIEMGDMY